MKKYIVMVGWVLTVTLALGGCNAVQEKEDDGLQQNSIAEQQTDADSAKEMKTATAGTETYRGFLIDNVLHSEEEGDIHYNVYIPDSYDGTKPYALFFTLPGYQGLYFQGVGVNLETEDFGFTAQDYNSEMIIVAPQLDDWGGTSARQTIALVEYFLSGYNIDEEIMGWLFGK